MRECPGVRILATSREGLGVGGEHVWPLRSLPRPGNDEDGHDAAASDAVVLFAERAEAARATFTLDASNAAAVAEICRRLDGIPLAIELAAARVVSMTPSEIRGLLDERFRLLTGGRRSAVERHQTLRATVDWSYSLLGERERAVFERLGVFAGSFDAPAAQAVVTGDGVEAWDVLDALTELVAKSMIVAEDTAEGTTRYQMLETLGQYARERLDEHGDTDRWRRRHAEYFADWAEDAGPGLARPRRARLAGPGECGARQPPGRGDLGPRPRRPRRHRPRPAHHRRARRRVPDRPGGGHRGVGRTGPAPRRDHLTAAALRRDRRCRVIPVPPRELRTRPGTRTASDRRWRAPRRARTPIGLRDARALCLGARGCGNERLRSHSTLPGCSTATSLAPRTAKPFM